MLLSAEARRGRGTLSVRFRQDACVMLRRYAQPLVRSFCHRAGKPANECTGEPLQRSGDARQRPRLRRGPCAANAAHRPRSASWSRKGLKGEQLKG